MTNSPHWSSASVPFRLEWRPSRWLVAALGVLALLASLSLLASALPVSVAGVLAAATLFWGGWSIRRQWRQPRHEIVIREAGARVEVDGAAVADFVVAWRGVLAFARWRDGTGRVRRRVWWPDTLPAAARRELRLAAPVETSPRDPASMAP